jgi:hypothetical protein
VSNINYLNINENFPVAGQDNDTGVFRDNFDTIKNSLRIAKDEIAALEAATAGLALSDTTDGEGSDFNLRRIENALLKNNRTEKFNGGSTTENITIDYQNGGYQIYEVAADIQMQFLNFPGDPVFVNEDTPIGMGKVRLELYGDTTERTITLITSGGTVIKKDPNFPASLTVTSRSDPIFIDVWRHSNEVIYMQYLGQYS